MRTIKNVRIEKGIPFTEDFKYRAGQRLNFTARSHQEWQESLFPGSTSKDFDIVVGPGYWFQTRIMPLISPRYVGSFMPTQCGYQRACLEMPREGSVSWDGEIGIVRLVHGNQRPSKVWMSLTPMEIYSQRSGVRRAKGNVLILGLGIGWMAQRVLERQQVAHVTIVETDRDILRFFGERLAGMFGDRVTLIQGDAYDHGNPKKNKNYNYDIALWDIWDGYYDVGWDRKFIEATLRRKNTLCWYWGSMSS